MSTPTVLGYIREQPERLAYVFANRDIFIDPFLEMFRKYDIRKVIFLGSGTSYNASHIAAYYMKHIAGIAAEAQYPTVFKNYEAADWTNLLRNDQVLFVGISQSGTSISTIEVMKDANKKGFPTLVLTGNLESEITSYAEQKAHLLAGDELTPPETKGYTTSLLSVYLWAAALAAQKGKMNPEEFDMALSDCEDMISHFQESLDESEAWYERNKTTIVNSDRIYILGYGIDFGTALEAQLKIGEMLRLPALGYEIEEYAHGPTMALCKAQTVFMIGSDETEYERMLTFAEAFRRFSDRVHIISCRESEHDERDLIFTHKANKYLAPMMYTLPFQFVAAKGAKDIGIDTAINPFNIHLAHLNKDGE